MPESKPLRWFIALNTQVGPWPQNRKFSETEVAEKYPNYPPAKLIDELLAGKAISPTDPDPVREAVPMSVAPVAPVAQAVIPK